MSVCLSVPHVTSLSPSPKKVIETENFAKQSCQIHYKGDKNTSRVMLLLSPSLLPPPPLPRPSDVSYECSFSFVRGDTIVRRRRNTHAFYNGMCMYRSYRMVQRNFNFLCIFRKLTISPLPISSYVFLI